MKMTPETEISALRGVGPKKAEAFRKLGVETLRDLAALFPRRYEDRTRFTPIALAMPDDTVCIRAMVANEPRLVRVRRGMEMVKSVFRLSFSMSILRSMASCEIDAATFFTGMCIVTRATRSDWFISIIRASWPSPRAFSRYSV